jgi:hypothetical protein
MDFALDYPVLLHRWARAGVMQLRRRHGVVALDLHGLHRRSEPVAAVASLDNAGPLAIGRCPRPLENGLRALPPFLQGVRMLRNFDHRSLDCVSSITPAMLRASIRQL